MIAEDLRPLVQKLMNIEIDCSIKQFLDEMSLNDPEYTEDALKKLKHSETAYYDYLSLCDKIMSLQEDIIYECF